MIVRRYADELELKATYRQKVRTFAMPFLATLLGVGGVWRTPCSGIIASCWVLDFDHFGSVYYEHAIVLRPGIGLAVLLNNRTLDRPRFVCSMARDG